MFLGLVNGVEQQLRALYALRSEEGHSRAEAADRLGIDRAMITRRLSGQSNMTLETVADMVWAGGGCIEVKIFDPSDAPAGNYAVPLHEPVTTIHQPITASVPVGQAVKTFSAKADAFA